MSGKPAVREAAGPLTLGAAFNPRANSIGFLRWLMAFLVIFSHAGPLGGFYGSHDLGEQLSREQSLGGVAVEGFFFFSGFLITQSRRGRSTVFRYFWRRCLRILPAYWTALLVTVCVFAPLAWHRVHGTWRGYWHTRDEPPLTYVWHNAALMLHQRGIAGLGDTIPFGIFGHDWNGSAWTLVYEFGGYILIGVLGLVGILAHRRAASLVALFIIGVNVITWLGLDASRVLPYFSDFHIQMLLAPYAFGMLFALWADQIPIDDRLAVAALGVALVTYDVGGWNIFGQYGLLYFLMWVAIRATRLQTWERFGDFSYGIYIFAWPLMQLAAYYGLEHRGWLAYHLTIIVAVHMMAFLSWHLVESPAMSLKDWTPRPLAALIHRGAPYVDRVKTRLVDPRFSSAPFAHRQAVITAGTRPHQAPRTLRGGALRYVGLWLVVALTATFCVVGRADAARIGAAAERARHHRAVERAACRPALGEHLPNIWGQPATSTTAEQTFQQHMAGRSNVFLRGRDGWVFWGDYQENDFSQALGRVVLDKAGVDRWATYLRGLRQQAAAGGSRFFVVIAPSKWDAYPGKLPLWAQRLRGQPRSFQRLMRAAPDVAFVDTRPALRASKVATYSPLNSHWTPYGAALAWKSIVRCMSTYDASLSRLALPSITGSTATTDESEFTPFGIATPSTKVWTTPTFASPLPAATGVSLSNGAAIDASNGVDLLQLPAETTAPSAPVAKTLLLIRDSTGNSLSRFTDASFQHTVQVAHPLTGLNPAMDLPSLIGQYHPAVTVFLMTERYLDLTPPVLKENP